MTIHHRIVALVPNAFRRFSLNIRDALHTDVGAASRFLYLDVLRLRLLSHLPESLLHLPLHLTLEILNVLRHLGVLRHEVVLLRQLRDVIVR